MKFPEYNRFPERAAGILTDKTLPHNKDSLNEFLKNSGCTGAETTRKVLQSWTEGGHIKTPGKRQTKHKDIELSR
jgi:hypothetical protein